MQEININHQNLSKLFVIDMWKLEYKIIKKKKIETNILMKGNGSEIRKKEREKGGKEMINQQKQYTYQYSITTIVTPFTSSLRSKSSWLIIHRCSNKNGNGLVTLANMTFF